ncbi:MAG: DNA-3-methyladenine glycosylase family protein [Thioalkalivibrionaceae bacterium]
MSPFERHHIIAPGHSTLKHPVDWKSAQSDLAERCSRMRALIARYPFELKSRGDPFETLVRSIVGQQISVKAADAVWHRLSQAFVITPVVLAESDNEGLRQCGLSLRKCEYIRDLAGHFADGRIDPAHFPTMDDATLIALLTDVRGIGRWTAEMFLIFHLLRPDVWPIDDIGVQKGVAEIYVEELGGRRLTGGELREFGERFRPWRSVATWYLWRALDPVPVAY